MHVIINDHIINTEHIDLVCKKSAQKSEKDTTPVFLLSIVFNSGVQAQIPFEGESKRNQAFKKLNDLIGSKTVTLI